MQYFQTWQNPVIPLLLGIPLIFLLLFYCCVYWSSKVVLYLRRYWVYYKFQPRTPRRVRFDCERGSNHLFPHRLSGSTNSTPILSGAGSHSRLLRSGTSPQLSGLMAHSSYLERHSNYRFSPMVQSHSDQMTMSPIRGGRPYDREPLLSSTGTSANSTPLHTSNNAPKAQVNNGNNTNSYQWHRRGSTPAGSSPSQMMWKQQQQSPQVSSINGNPTSVLEVGKQRRNSTPNSPTTYPPPSPSSSSSLMSSIVSHNHQANPKRVDSNYSSISYLPEVRAYLQFMELDPPSRQRSHSFSGVHSPCRSSSNRSGRSATRTRSARHHRPRSRSPSPYALERTAMGQMASDDLMSNYSSSYGRYLTPQGSSDQGSFKSPESGTPDWIDAPDAPIPMTGARTGSPSASTASAPPMESSVSSSGHGVPRSSSSGIRTSFI